MLYDSKQAGNCPVIRYTVKRNGKPENDNCGTPAAMSKAETAFSNFAADLRLNYMEVPNAENGAVPTS